MSVKQNVKQNQCPSSKNNIIKRHDEVGKKLKCHSRKTRQAVRKRPSGCFIASTNDSCRLLNIGASTGWDELSLNCDACLSQIFNFNRSLSTKPTTTLEYCRYPVMKLITLESVYCTGDSGLLFLRPRCYTSCFHLSSIVMCGQLDCNPMSWSAKHIHVVISLK
jgi:hypothetical protein